LANFTILSGERFKQTDVEVQYVAGTGNAMPKDRATEILIEEIWYVAVREAKKRHVNIFNGKLFRLKNITVANNASLFLGLGDTDYKEYIATRTARFWRDHQFNELSNPLATCIAIVTSDGKIIIEKRGNVDVYSKQYHVIGGFMDRLQDFNRYNPDPFKAIIREVKEEVGLTLHNTTIQIVGIVYDLITPHPEMCFCAESNLSSEEIVYIFAHSKKDLEVNKLEFVDASADKLAQFILSQRHLTAVTGQACLTLYGKHTYGTPWFRKVIDALG